MEQVLVVRISPCHPVGQGRERACAIAHSTTVIVLINPLHIGLIYMFLIDLHFLKISYYEQE